MLSRTALLYQCQWIYTALYFVLLLTYFFFLHPFSASSTRFGITFFLDCCDCNVKQAKAMIVVITIIIMMEDNDIAELTRKITVIISLRAHCMCAVTLNFLLTAYAISPNCSEHFSVASNAFHHFLHVFIFFVILLFCICHVMHPRLCRNIRLTCFPSALIWLVTIMRSRLKKNLYYSQYIHSLFWYSLHETVNPAEI